MADHDDPTSPEARMDVAMKQLRLASDDVEDAETVVAIADVMDEIEALQKRLVPTVITDGGRVEPGCGDRVTYIDGDGNEEFGIVLEPVPDVEYITVAATPVDPREEYAGGTWEVHTSVYPHTDLGEQYTATGYAFKPGWDA